MILACLGSFAFQETCSLFQHDRIILRFLPVMTLLQLPQPYRHLALSLVFLFQEKVQKDSLETRGIKVPGATNQTGPEERATPEETQEVRA